MKIVMKLSIPFIMFASSDTLGKGETLDEHENRSIAKEIAREETKEEVISLKLTHTNKYLIYKDIVLSM